MCVYLSYVANLKLTSQSRGSCEILFRRHTKNSHWVVHKHLTLMHIPVTNSYISVTISDITKKKKTPNMKPFQQRVLSRLEKALIIKYHCKFWHCPLGGGAR